MSQQKSTMELIKMLSDFVEERVVEDKTDIQRVVEAICTPHIKKEVSIQISFGE